MKDIFGKAHQAVRKAKEAGTDQTQMGFATVFSVRGITFLKIL